MECLEILSKALGKDLRVDSFTDESPKGEFARARIEIDLSKPLIAHVLIDNKKREVKYKGLDLICFNCGGVGHAREVCSEEKENGVGEDVSMAEKITGAELRPKEGSEGNGEVRYDPRMQVQPRSHQKLAPTVRLAGVGNVDSRRRTVVVGGDKGKGVLFSDEEGNKGYKGGFGLGRKKCEWEKRRIGPRITFHGLRGGCGLG